MNYAGEYYLSGIMETASGFNLYEDKSFEFYFTYGALDRHAYGSWREGENGTLILTTSYGDQMPFTIESEANMKDNDHLVVGIPGFNKVLLKETKIAATYNGIEEEQADSRDDVFHFTFPSADKLVVTCLFYFDNPATLTPSDAKNNYVELKPNQNLLLVHFNDAVFTIEGNNLKGRLLFADPDRLLTFVKAV